MNAQDLALPDMGLSYREQNPEHNFDLMRTTSPEEQDIIKACLEKARRAKA
jgi:hypothetical protein